MHVLRRRLVLLTVPHTLKTTWLKNKIIVEVPGWKCMLSIWQHKSDEQIFKSSTGAHKYVVIIQGLNLKAAWTNRKI